MRARLLKPGFFRNEALSSLSPWHRLLFQGLWLCADREGKLRDQPKVIAGELFALDEAIGFREVDAMVADLAAHPDGLLQRYAIEGRSYLRLPGFARHQTPHIREAASEIPDPVPGTVLSTGPSIVLSPSVPVPVPVPKTVRDGGRRARSSGKRIPIEDPPGFADFWSIWPRTSGKDDARRAWVGLTPAEQQRATVAAPRQIATTFAGRDTAAIPHAATWLNKRRFEDEPEKAGAVSVPPRYVTAADTRKALEADTEQHDPAVAAGLGDLLGKLKQGRTA